MKTRSRISRLPLQAIPTNNTQKEKKGSVKEEPSEPFQLVNGAASTHHGNVCELKTKVQSRMKGALPVKVSTPRKRLASPGDSPAAKRKVKDEKVDKDEALSSSESEEMEEEVNIHYDELIVDKSHDQLLSVQLQRLLVCFDVYLETEVLDVSAPVEIPKEKVIPRASRGPGRSKPYKYIPELAIFTQR